MKTVSSRQPINLKVVRFELDFTSLVREDKPIERKPKIIEVPKVNSLRRKSFVPSPPPLRKTENRRDVKSLVEELLDELYADQRDWSCGSAVNSHGSTSAASVASSQSICGDNTDVFEYSYLDILDIPELLQLRAEYEEKLQTIGEKLSRCVRTRDRLKRQQKRLCGAFTVLLRHITGDTTARFGISPALGNEGPGEGGFTEWLHAMRLVARLPAGVPQHFRRKLWLTLAERHITARGIDWPAAERGCFRGTAQPDDAELGQQILKDLHRTGCSLFCGTEGRENQAMLRRVLLAYARWNKDVGYCQGFNMIAAIILEVMDKSESDSLKVMIYLVEAVLPEGYFADDLRGLSADMAAFRDLLRLRIPRLAHHMDYLQKISDGGGVEPPLPDVFTMQWFLTLYATWLPRDSLLRIWDLVLLDGNEVLLLTALAIWDMLQDRILSARSADEFYSCMGGGAGAVYAAGEALPARVVALGAAPELPRLRSLHRYTVTPPAPNHPPLQTAMQSVTKRGLRLFYSEDEGDSSDDGNKMALATVMIPRREDRLGAGDRLTLDIGALKRQYARLRERQRQAHVILAAACARHAAVGVPTSPTSLTVNNLLLGKSAIISSRGRRLGPPPGAVPPSRQTLSPLDPSSSRSKSETITWDEEHNRKSLSRRNSVKWKDIKKEKEGKYRKASIDLDEAGDGIIVSEREANEMIASLRSRNTSESSSYSSHSGSSTDTSLCDENEKASDSELDLPEDKKIANSILDTKKAASKEFSPAIFKNESSTMAEKSPIQSNDTVDMINIFNPDKTIYDYKPKSIENISDYLDSAAGKPLRSYIDGFESKLNDSTIISSKHRLEQSTELVNKKSIPIKTTEKEETYKASEFHKFRKNITDLSPIDISPCDYGIGETHSPYDYESMFRHHSTSKLEKNTRPNDIIENLTRYPDFVPDINLTEKTCVSPYRSPGVESILVSEDEHPIPLRIDKYFEYSPEFFGARVTDPNNLDIPNRRATKRHIRLPKKPDSLTLQSSHNDKITKMDVERASSLPQSHSFTEIIESPSLIKSNEITDKMEYTTNILNKSTHNLNCILTSENSEKSKGNIETFSPKDYFLRSGRKNSERALQIIQENSKILSRILTKQHIAEAANKLASECFEDKREEIYSRYIPPQNESKILSSPQILKESTSDSLIDSIKCSKLSDNDKNSYVKVRPISIDDPFSLEIRSTNVFSNDEHKPPNECLGNKTDLYGWENKGFLVKSDSDPYKSDTNIDHGFRRKDAISCKESSSNELKHPYISEFNLPSSSSETKTSVTLPSKPKITPTIEKNITREDFNYPVSSKYNDFVLSKASDICSDTIDGGPKICETILKTDNSQVSDFAHLVTSSISFTYEPSAEDDSPIGAKSNSSDTLCQIASLDQVSTPMSPKIFPNRETPKDFIEKSETISRTKIETDDTCSAITSLIETDTPSSLSYPRSPSTGSYHPFPTRPSLRMPKELGVKLGMYPKDSIRSPSKQFGES